MASAFIIRPFGTKEGIDFERVEKELIDPALAGHRLLGRTTADVLKQGNIRTEMFYRLLTADVVIVDISISNANVFYELGIRHALRDKRTFMIRGSSAALPATDVPFDLKTDRYLAYPNDNPAAALATLTEALRQTLLSEDKDSPVFQLLPELQEQDRARFLGVPPEFLEEVQYASQQPERRYQLGDLKLLQTEALGFQWQPTGLRVVGRVQFNKEAYEDARDTWEAVRRDAPKDKEANTWLGTIYQRLQQLPQANAALQRVLKTTGLTPGERAEAHALLGRNKKAQWQSQWTAQPLAQRPEAALSSALLAEAYAEYRAGFREDLNHYYPGINALGLLVTRLALATALPDVWAGSFESDDEAANELKRLKAELANLQGSVTLALEAAQDRASRAGEADAWQAITSADLACLVSVRPKRVAQLYEDALAAADNFAVNSVRRQLQLYQQLGVAPANVAQALSIARLTPPAAPGPAETPADSKEAVPYVLLFTGHQVDAPGRAKPRFPTDMEAVAGQAIEQAIREEIADKQGPIIGLSGGANGGDILFHEACERLGIPSLLYLAMPRDAFVSESVRAAGPGWVKRFDKLYDQLPIRVLGPTRELPTWLQLKPDYGIWQRNNLWMLYNALALGSQHVTLMALWDEAPAGNGPGGTQDMVEQAQASGANLQIISTKSLFGLAE